MLLLRFVSLLALLLLLQLLLLLLLSLGAAAAAAGAVGGARAGAAACAAVGAAAGAFATGAVAVAARCSLLLLDAAARCWCCCCCCGCCCGRCCCCCFLCYCWCYCCCCSCSCCWCRHSVLLSGLGVPCVLGGLWLLCLWGVFSWFATRPEIMRRGTWAVFCAPEDSTYSYSMSPRDPPKCSCVGTKDTHVHRCSPAAYVTSALCCLVVGTLAVDLTAQSYICISVLAIVYVFVCFTRYSYMQIYPRSFFSETAKSPR